MSEWFKITDGCQIEFQKSPHRYWPPEILRSNRLSIAGHLQSSWMLTGQGPMWMYAHAAAMVAAAGFRHNVRLAGSPGTSEDLTTSQCKLHRGPDAQCAVLEIQFGVGTQLADSAIETLMEAALANLQSSKIREMCITGRANGMAYAWAAARAVDNKIERLTCWTPADGLVVVYDKEATSIGERPEPPSWLLPYMKPPEYPVVVGVVGDPNCGKSVFSLALNHYRGVINCRGWRLDCDGASPTPDWYLSLNESNPDRAKEAREAVKLSWTPEMEDSIAERIKRLRQFFDVAIADLPGGNHKKTPPDRIPNHREVMMREVDVLVLIERTEQPTELAWRTALAPHRLADRIAIVLRSEDPKGLPRLDVWTDSDGTWRGVIRGLDRKKKPDELVNAFQTGFERLWPVLLRHGRKGGVGQ